MCKKIFLLVILFMLTVSSAFPVKANLPPVDEPPEASTVTKPPYFIYLPVVNGGEAIVQTAEQNCN
jgi:biopolymer transport protein ExbD